jgi:ribosomal protein S24E
MYNEFIARRTYVSQVSYMNYNQTVLSQCIPIIFKFVASLSFGLRAHIHTMTSHAGTSNSRGTFHLFQRDAQADHFT